MERFLAMSGSETAPGSWVIPLFVAAVSILSTIIGALFTMVMRHMYIDTAKFESLTAATDKVRADTAAAINSTRELALQALADYKLQAMKEFASSGDLHEVEARIVKALDKIQTSLDALTKAGLDGGRSTTR